MNQFDQIKEEVLFLVSSAKYQRMRPHEVEKNLSKKLGVSLFMVKEALEDLVEQRELVFTYRDPSSYVEVPSAGGLPGAHPMKVVMDDNGEPWICEADVDPSQNLAEQGGWRYKKMAYSRR